MNERELQKLEASCELPLKVVRRVTWVGSDGGHKIGDELDFKNHFFTLVRERKSGDVFFVDDACLKLYPSEPIEEPAVR